MLGLGGGWWVVWRFQYPDTGGYSCYFKTHKSLSRIDTVLAEGDGLELVREIAYLPGVFSDYSPFVLDLSLEPKPGIRHWRMKGSWLQE